MPGKIHGMDKDDGLLFILIDVMNYHDHTSEIAPFAHGAIDFSGH